MGLRETNSPQQDYEQFFNDNPIPAVVYDAEDLGIMVVNKAAIKTYGYSEAEFLTKTVLDLSPEEERDLYKQTIKDIIEFGGSDSEQWRHVKKCGIAFYVHIFSNITSFNGKKAILSLTYDINKRILVERENKELNDIIKGQKEELDGILSSVKEAVWSRRISDGRLVYINNASIDIFGYTPEEMTRDGGASLEHVHPDDLSLLKEKVKQNYREGNSEMEYRIFHKDGSMKYVLTQANVKRNEEGEPILYTGITVDITKLRLAELALKKKIQEIENVFESINDCFISIDKDWTITYVNKHFETLTHTKREDIVGQNFWEKFPRIVESPYRKDYLKAMNDREAVHSEGLSPSTGRILSVYFYPTDVGIAVYFKDITEEQVLNNEIANKEQKLRSIINNTKDIIWSIDTQGALISANEAYYNRLKIITGKQNIEDVTDVDFGEDRIKKWGAYYSRVLSGETFSVIEEDVLNDKTVFEEVSFNTIFDKDNKIIGASCFSRDITERIEQLLMIQEQNEKLKNIAWIQSHKVRGPVATILGLINLLDISQPEDPANKDILLGIKEVSLQLDNVIREVVNNTIV